MNESEINALIALLDDTDEEVIHHVNAKLLEYGDEILPFLEDRYLNEEDPNIQARINKIIELIHFEGLKQELHAWAEGGGLDIFEGIYLVSKYRYPELNRQTLSNQLDKMKLEAWLELNVQLAPLDKVRILNYVIFDVNGLKGNSDNYHNPENSYINKVLEMKLGNPISLAIIYSIIAQRLNIPIFGVNLPQHFVLAFKDETKLKPITSYNGNDYMDYRTDGAVMFYINAFNKGAIFSSSNIDQFLVQLKIKPMEIYYEPCSNVDIIMRVFRNLTVSYEKLEDNERLEAIKELIMVIQPFATIL